MAWKEYCAEYWLKEIQENMDRCTGRRDITEILLKMSLNTIQSINQQQKIQYAWQKRVRIHQSFSRTFPLFLYKML